MKDRSAQPARYIPALSFRSLTPLFDPFLKWLMREERFKRALTQQARLARGHRVLDLGCGTGTLTMMLKRAEPAAAVLGMDGDAAILDIAQSKAAHARVAVDWNLGFTLQLPYRDESFDRVTASLVMHHLTTENKRRTLAEIYRVLKSNGQVHIVDFGAPHRASARVLSMWARRLEETADLIDGKFTEMLRGGYADVAVTRQFMSVVGTLALYQARRDG